MKKNKWVSNSFLFAFLIVLCVGCKPLISLYDQYAYTQATSLKVDLQNLISESATTTYSEAKSDVAKVNSELQKAYEYAKGRSQNGISTKQYEIMLSDEHFYKKFLKDWEVQKKETQTAAEEESIKIGQLMDKIIQLENGKNKKEEK